MKAEVILESSSFTETRIIQKENIPKISTAQTLVKEHQP